LKLKRYENHLKCQEVKLPKFQWIIGKKNVPSALKIDVNFAFLAVRINFAQHAFEDTLRRLLIILGAYQDAR